MFFLNSDHLRLHDVKKYINRLAIVTLFFANLKSNLKKKSNYLRNPEKRSSHRQSKYTVIIL